MTKNVRTNKSSLHMGTPNGRRLRVDCIHILEFTGWLTDNDPQPITCLISSLNITGGYRVVITKDLGLSVDR